MNADDNREALWELIADKPPEWAVTDWLLGNRDAVLRALGKDTSLNCDECMADYGRGFEDGKASMKARAEAAEAERDHFMDKWRDEKKRHLKAEAERDTLADHFRIDSRWIEHLEKVARKAVARAEAAERQRDAYSEALGLAEVHGSRAAERADKAERKVARAKTVLDAWQLSESRFQTVRDIEADLAAALADEEPT